MGRKLWITPDQTWWIPPWKFIPELACPRSWLDAGERAPRTRQVRAPDTCRYNPTCARAKRVWLVLCDFALVWKTGHEHCCKTERMLVNVSSELLPVP